MIYIQLFAYLTDSPDFQIEASVKGSIITINGEDFDFNPLEDGQRLPYSAIDSPYFVPGTYVERKGRDLYMTLYLRVSADSPEELRNPAKPIVIPVNSGKVKFPDTTPVGVKSEN